MISIEQVKKLYGNKETYTKGNNIASGLTCPHCKKPKGYIDLNQSTFIFCNRYGCIHHFSKKNGYNILTDIRKDTAKLKAPFNEYLTSRGLDYTQVGYGFIVHANKIIFQLQDNRTKQYINILTNEKRFPIDSKPQLTYYSALANNHHDLLVMVESILCALTLQQNGYNAIAYLSTNYKMNPTILQLIKQYKQVALILDNDQNNAGLLYIQNNYKLLKDNEIPFKVYTLNNYKDVNEIVTQGGNLKDELHQVTLQASSTQGLIHE